MERRLGNKTSALEIIGEVKVEAEKPDLANAPADWSPENPTSSEQSADNRPKGDPDNLAGLYAALGIEAAIGSSSGKDKLSVGKIDTQSKAEKTDAQKIKELDR